MELNDLITQRPVWLKASPEPNPILLSVETIISRNLEKFPFPSKSSLQQKNEIFSAIESAVKTRAVLGENPFTINLDEVNDLAKTVLFERDFVPIEMINGGVGARGVILNEYDMAIRVNSENHIRISHYSDGTDLQKSWEMVDTSDTLLGKELTYAFDPAVGYLLSRPDQCGSGLEISYTLQLSGLVYTETLDQVLSGAAQLGMSGEGKFRQGTDSWGGMYVLTGGSFLGTSEKEIREKSETAVQAVISKELEAREVLFREAPMEMEDKIWRAFGVLKNCRMLSVPQLLNLTSQVRMGLERGYVMDGLTIDTINGIVATTLQGNVALMLEREPSDSSELDIERANIVRTILDI